LPRAMRAFLSEGIPLGKLVRSAKLSPGVLRT
jgi:hypothetical protein